jgi:hypothetical protein
MFNIFKIFSKKSKNSETEVTHTSNDYVDENRIGIIVKIGNFDWQTNSTYFNKNEFLKDEDGIIHIYSKNNEGRDLLFYQTAQQALA